MVMKKWPEAIALFDRASDHVIQAIEQYRVLEHSGVEATKIDKVLVLPAYLFLFLHATRLQIAQCPATYVRIGFTFTLLRFCSLPQSIPDLHKLQATIRGKKCEVHVTSIVEEQHLEEKMADMSLASKVWEGRGWYPTLLCIA